MIEINTAYPGSAAYARVSDFAKAIYAKRLRSDTAAAPDVFAYALHGVNIVGCLGLNRADKRAPLFFELCDPPGACERLTGKTPPDRREVGELGSRAVALPDGAGVRSSDVSIALTGALVCFARESGIRYLGFVTNRLVRSITDALGFELVSLGQPDFSQQNETFKENMRGFLETKQVCMGFEMHSLAQCRQALQDFSQRGIVVSAQYP